MMNLLGGSATATDFSEVYTVIQSVVIDSVENNELSLTEVGLLSITYISAITMWLPTLVRLV